MQRVMNTASRYRLIHHTVEEYIRGTERRHTPVTRIKVSKDKSTGTFTVQVYTSRPAILRGEQSDLSGALRELAGEGRTVNLEVVPEARAVAKFVRTSPRKARLVIDAIKGKRVSEALALLRFIPKIAAEPVSKVLRSAAANAQDGWGAIPEELKIANFIADGGPVLKRVQPRAQGRAYRILKRSSHLTVVLTEMPAPVTRRRPQGKPKAKANVAAPAAAVSAPAPAAPARSRKKAAAPATETPATEETVATAATQQPEITAEAVPNRPEPEEATPVTESESPEQDGGAAPLDGQGEAEPNQE